MSRFPVFFGLITLSFALLVGAGASQEGKKDKDDPKKAKGMLPAGFKDLGLTATQKGRIYEIQGDYKAKISELEKKVKELKAMESQDIFKVLTDDQRAQYLKAKGVETKDKVGDKKDSEKDKKGDKEK